MGSARLWLRVYGFEPHQAHQPLHTFVFDGVPLPVQPIRHAENAKERPPRVLLVDQAHQKEVVGVLAFGLGVVARAG